jgi:hypothetical protein
MQTFLRNRVALFLVALNLLLSGANDVPAQDKPIQRDRPLKNVNKVEKAIDEGLIWLLYQQSADGSWLADETIDPNTKQARPRMGRNGSTALVMLSLLAQGYMPGKKSRVDQAMLRAELFLLQAGQITPGKEVSWIEKDGGQLSHALCTITLCVLYHYSEDKRLLPYCQGAVKLLENNVDRKRHGWGLQPGEVPDLEVTYWCCEALRCGNMNYITPSPETIKSLLQFMDGVTPVEKIGALPPTTLGMYIDARFNLGWRNYDHQGIQQSIPVLSRYVPTLRDPATNFYVGNMMIRFDKETEQAWLQQMPALLVQGQVHQGLSRGSWPPGETSALTRLGQNRLESTCLALMTITLEKRSPKYIKRYPREFEGAFPL